MRALGADNLVEAQKQANQAMVLAPGHPDVLYLQGVIFLKQRDWSKAQEVLEKATQLDPSDAHAFTALGMALCDQGKYEAAVGPLEKAILRYISWHPAALDDILRCARRHALARHRGLRPGAWTRRRDRQSCER